MAGKYGEEREKEEDEIERVFKWGPEQEKAIRDLKHALVSLPALLPIVYTAEPGRKTAGRIVLAVDASRLGYGAILQQQDENGRRHPARYMSGLWTDTERNYTTGKLECQALLRAVKEFRNYSLQSICSLRSMRKP